MAIIIPIVGWKKVDKIKFGHDLHNYLQKLDHLTQNVNYLELYRWLEQPKTFIVNW